MKKKKRENLLSEYILETGIDNPVLRTVCDEITDFWPELKQLSQDMQQLMRVYYGTWLAAPQIGHTIQIIATIQRKSKGKKMIEIGETVLVNPQIIKESDKYIKSEESCLSIPDYSGIVQRKKSITVSYQDIHGQRKEREFHGYNGTVIQHEIDHLNGILFIDRLTQIKK